MLILISILDKYTILELGYWALYTSRDSSLLQNIVIFGSRHVKPMNEFS